MSAAAQGPIDARLEAYRAMFRLDGKTALVLGAASGIGARAITGADVGCAAATPGSSSKGAMIAHSASVRSLP